MNIAIAATIVAARLRVLLRAAPGRECFPKLQSGRSIQDWRDISLYPVASSSRDDATSC